MVLDIDPAEVRRERDLENVEYSLYRSATELAVLGEVETARDLVSVLYEEGVPTGFHTWVDRRLMVAWKASGKIPRGLSDQKVQQAADGVKHIYEDDPEKGITFDAEYLEKCLPPIRGRASPPIPPDDIVKALVISLALSSQDQPGIMALRSGAQVPKTTEDSAGRRLSISDLDATSRELTQMVADRWGRRMIDALVVAEQLWPYHVRGLLAEALGVSAEELKSKGESLVRAFSDRLSRGCTENGLESKTLKELLEIGEKNTLTGPGVRHQEEMGGSTTETMFKQPATSEQILELESRLGVSLPQDYKEFLVTTNGFGGKDGSIFNGYYPDPELFAADDVEWLSEDWIALPFEMLKIPREIEDPYRNPSPEAWDTAMPLVDRVVHVGNRDIDDLWLVPPGLVHKAKSAYLEMLEKGDAMEKKILQRAIKDFAGSMEQFMKLEWCCIKNTCGSGPACHVFSSFRSYLESVVYNSGKDKRSRTRKSW